MRRRAKHARLGFVDRALDLTVQRSCGVRETRSG
jgi:hypothetical protein